MKTQNEWHGDGEALGWFEMPKLKKVFNFQMNFIVTHKKDTFFH